MANKMIWKLANILIKLLLHQIPTILPPSSKPINYTKKDSLPGSPEKYPFKPLRKLHP